MEHLLNPQIAQMGADYFKGVPSSRGAQRRGDPGFAMLFELDCRASLAVTKAGAFADITKDIP